MNRRYLTVPKNIKGEHDYDYGVEDSPNIVTYLLPEKEFEVLYGDGIFSTINRDCDLLIDDYESEIIPKDKIKTCMSIIAPYTKHVPVFNEALCYAYKMGRFLALDF